jgi:dsDNA-specific endonuclease/ATPase MutS2
VARSPLGAGLLRSGHLLDKSMTDEENGTDKKMNENEPIEIPIDGTLDLHTFRPRDVKDLVPTYLAACRERGLLQVRIIHGKGTGQLRETVHAVLGRLPEVASFRLAGEDGGGWGATLVILRALNEKLG